jgi:tight adherence protein B
MWAPLAVFAGVVAVIIGAYWALVVRQEEKFIQRLRPKTEKGRLLKDVLKPEETLSAVGPLHAALERSRYVGPLKQMLEQSGVKMNLASFLLLTGCVFLGAYLVATTVTGLPLVGLIAGAVLGYIPYFYVKFVRNRRMLKFEEHFPEAIDLIARALRACHALPTGLGMVADELPAPVGTEFRILFDEQNFGLTLGDALRNFAKRVPVLDARFFVTAVLTQRESGGNLAEVLDNLSSVIRDRFKVKRQIRVISAHGRITGTVLAGLPPSLALVTLFLNPEHLGTLTHDPIGVRMIYGALILQVVGTLVMRRIINIEY